MLGSVICPTGRRREQSPLDAMKDARKSVRQCAKFASGFNLIWVVQSLAQKYFAFHSSPIGGYSRASRLDRRGVAHRHGR